jgi:hypothetical protein
LVVQPSPHAHLWLISVAATSDELSTCFHWKTVISSSKPVHLEGHLKSVDDVDHLGELGERCEDARGRLQHVVEDKGVLLEVFEVGPSLGAAKREVLDGQRATV